MIDEFADAIFRANPAYDLVLLERLSAVERECMGELQEGEALYGCLRPHRGSGLEWRSASEDTALLLLTLKEPGPIPAYVRTSLGGDTGNVVARLVLDGVLEIKHNGSFCSGPAAQDVVLPSAGKREPGAIARLSIEALEYGQALEGLAAHELALRLYFFGRRPVSPSRQSRLSNEEAVRAYLGLGREGPVQTALDASWVQDFREQLHWRMWTPRLGGVGPERAAYKLYISPEAASLPDAFLATVETLPSISGVQAFKVGRELCGLCRPDKLVAYFSRLDALQLAASRLRERIQGYPAHPVPFTAEVTRDGLLSWGIDPPPERRFTGTRACGSWRLWVADRLAEYLLAARATRSDATAYWKFALDRLRFDGVDTDTWVPVSGIWSH